MNLEWLRELSYIMMHPSASILLVVGRDRGFYILVHFSAKSTEL